MARYLQFSIVDIVTDKLTFSSFYPCTISGGSQTIDYLSVFIYDFPFKRNYVLLINATMVLF